MLVFTVSHLKMVTLKSCFRAVVIDSEVIGVLKQKSCLCAGSVVY